MVDIEKLLDGFGGKVLTNAEFNRTPFSIFNSIIEQPLPQEQLDENIDEDGKIFNKKS